jgi:hypothetical protein
LHATQSRRRALLKTPLAALGASVAQSPGAYLPADPPESGPRTPSRAAGVGVLKTPRGALSTGPPEPLGCLSSEPGSGTAARSRVNATSCPHRDEIVDPGGFPAADCAGRTLGETLGDAGGEFLRGIGEILPNRREKGLVTEQVPKIVTQQVHRAARDGAEEAAKKRTNLRVRPAGRPSEPRFHTRTDRPIAYRIPRPAVLTVLPRGERPLGLTTGLRAHPPMQEGAFPPITVGGHIIV